MKRVVLIWILFTVSAVPVLGGAFQTTVSIFTDANSVVHPYLYVGAGGQLTPMTTRWFSNIEGESTTAPNAT